MADERKAKDRPVRRVFQQHRLQEQLWTTAYQMMGPSVRVLASAARHQLVLGAQKPASANMARSA